MSRIVTVLIIVSTVMVTGDIDSIFKSAGIVPHVIPAAPPKVVNIKLYLNNNELKPGDNVTAWDLEVLPKILFDFENSKNVTTQHHTLMLIEPNSKNNNESTLHWLMVHAGVKGNSKTIVKYVGGLGKSKAQRKFILLVYVENGQEFKDERTLNFINPDQCRKFVLGAFLDKHGLHHHDLVAGTFFVINSSTTAKCSFVIVLTFFTFFLK